MIFRDSPEKHLYSDAVVWLAAIIRGLLFPLILTSIVGMDAYSGGYPFSISGDIRSVPS